MLKKFFVVADSPASRQELEQELVSSLGDDIIPQRPVEVVESKGEFTSVVLLDTNEVEALYSDLRILDIQPDPKELGVKKMHTGVRDYTFSKSAIPANGDANWGLVRSNFLTNVFAGNNTTSTNFTYNLDGTGVDVIIIDTGVEPNHPELAVNADGTGGTRVVDHDWTQYGYITTVPTGGFLGDCDGHGTNVASIVAGNTCGWAPGAKIYTLRSVGSGATTEYDITDGRELGILDDFDVWQSVRAFHAAKTVDPKTGYKRPTIVNCSFGFFIDYSSVTAINYRGTSYSVSTTTAAYGTIGISDGGSGVHGYRYSSLDAEVQATIDAGIIVVGAAGNDRHKIDVVGGVDYNNYWTEYTGFSYYYHRGASPSATSNVINVGCIAALSPSGVEHKRNFSCAGPRVDIWAPGDLIQGGYSNSYYSASAVADSRNTNYYLQKVSGTSQACPQVVGVLACLLQARPWYNQSKCRNWLTSVAATWNPDESYYGGSGYTNYGSLQGGPARALYQPFNSDTPLKLD